MNIIIQNSSGKPIYEQIYTQVKEQIISGTLVSGEMMPSMRLLAKELRISLITTKRAYEDLTRDGFLESIPGKGCFVLAQNPELLYEARLRQIETHLTAALEEAQRGHTPTALLHEMLDTLAGGE